MQAAMGGVGPMTFARLAAAISEAGALGQLAHPSLSLEEFGATGDALQRQVDEVVRIVREGIHEAVGLTDRPLAVNVRIAQEQPDAKRLIEAILEERDADPDVRKQLRVLTTSGGHPETYGLNDRIREAGMLHLHAVSNVRHALTAQRAGIDAVIATGYEAAGHVGHFPVHTFVLIPAVAESVDLPVIAAGGVVDGVSLVGALALGAQLGYIGSRFLASEEAEYHEAAKRAVVDAAETSTDVVPAFFGPGRYIANAYTEEVRRMTEAGTPALERLQWEGAALRRGALEGDVEHGAMIGGMAVGRIKQILPAAEIVRRIGVEADEALERISGYRG